MREFVGLPAVAGTILNSQLESFMKQSVFITLVMVVAFIASVLIYFFTLPQFIKDGGYLVIALITLTIMVTTFIFERLLSLRKAQGKNAIPTFLRNVQGALHEKDIAQAIQLCAEQRGSLATVLKNGLERYQNLSRTGAVLEQREVMDEVQHAIDEALMLEVPLLEKNLIALSTIASVSTMIGLLGTVLGMIRSFQAMANAGAPDAIQLSIGISEALINTAGGLIAAIAGIIAYNFFVTKVDNVTYQIDEASASMLQSLVRHH